MKLTLSKFNTKAAVMRASGFVRTHYGGLLLCLFFAAIALWVFVFWRYGIAFPRQIEDVSVRIVKVKEADLRKITDDIQERRKAAESASEKSFLDPFINSAEAL